MDLTGFICSFHSIVQPQFSQQDLHDQCSILLPLFLGPLLLPLPGEQGGEVGGRDGGGDGDSLQSRDPSKKKFFLETAQDKTLSLPPCIKMAFYIDMANHALSVRQSIRY